MFSPFLSRLPTTLPVRLRSASARLKSTINPTGESFTSAAPRLTLPTAFTANPGRAGAALCLSSAGIITVLISVGGLTRLTKSGLSMTYWKPTQILPPQTYDEWMLEFDGYKSFPEFAQRQNMTLDEFKSIYYWEWGHRILGRVVGAWYGGGLALLAVTKNIPVGYGPRLTGLLVLGGAQGAVGWWMVQSGLGEDRRGDRKEIRVSPYRLASHLTVAFATYTGLVWTGLELLYPKTARASAAKLVADKIKGSKGVIKELARFRRLALLSTALTAVTVTSGAFVAGNDAGNAYNDWPYMNGQFVPWEDMIDPAIDGPVYRNIFETTAMVQFNHRNLAYATSAAVAATVAYETTLKTTLAKANLSSILTPQVTRGLYVMGGLAVTQVSLGISTLMLYVPVHLAATHQLGSLALLTSGLFLSHSVRYLGTAVAKAGGKKVAEKAVEEGARKVVKAAS